MSLFKKQKPESKIKTPVYVSKLGKGTSTQYKLKKNNVGPKKGVRKSLVQRCISIVPNFINKLRRKKDDEPESIDL